MAEIIVGAIVESVCSALFALAMNEARKIDLNSQFEQMKAWQLAIPCKESQEKIIIGSNEEAVTLMKLIRATGNFSNKKKIGSGFLGAVYVAELKDRKVAVKRFSEEKIQGLKVEMLSFIKSLRHENLIELLDIHIGDGVQLLVYEYMEHQSLEDALFESHKLELPWKTRFNICMGIARGLEFLHKNPRYKIVHGNIKPSNILLDRDFQPKLSDIDLAKIYTDEDQPIFPTKAALKGYLAPEYFQSSEATRETDIFSFGVVLLEIVSGQKNVLSRPNRESRYLLNEVRTYFTCGKLVQMVDKRLGKNFDVKEALILLKLAVMCTNISPSLRPNISQILSVLTRKETIEEICQSTDESCKKGISTVDATEVADKNDVSNPKESTSSASTSTALIDNYTLGQKEMEILVSRCWEKILEELNNRDIIIVPKKKSAHKLRLRKRNV